jgi:hypothetical protein
MKKLIFLLIVLFPMASVWAQTAEKDKDSYVKKAETEFKEWNAKVDELRAKSEKAGSKTRKDLDAQMKTLEDNLTAARKGLTNLQGSSESSWIGFRKDMEKALREVKNSYEKTVSFFKRNEP